jgi:redox-sensing transcriptional repressor
LTGIGEALLTQESVFRNNGYPILAGFDGNVNRMELLRTNVPLHPLSEMAETIRSAGISLAILATDGMATRKILERLVLGQVKGILNLSTVLLKSPKAEIKLINNHPLAGLTLLSALLHLARQEEANHV